MEESVPFKQLSEEVENELHQLSCGSVLLNFDAAKNKGGGAALGIEPIHSFAFCAWKGRYTIRAYVKACEREHFLRLTGTSLEAVNLAKKVKKDVEAETKEVCLEVEKESPNEGTPPKDVALTEQDV